MSNHKDNFKAFNNIKMQTLKKKCTLKTKVITCILYVYYIHSYSSICYIYYMYIYNVWKSLSHVRLFLIPWAVTCQAPLSMELSRRNTGVGTHSFLQGIFPTQRSNPGLPHFRQILYRLSHQAVYSQQPCVYIIYYLNRGKKRSKTQATCNWK